ncbi:protein TolQ [Nitrosococcus oceani]|uniref:Tol-Pal system protein TolQ n=2 Tax=Nitrosococcus oceani TaxID=1229 RepID=Q3JES1_NITOC|nr:protein TolQ [Nitrosococcus oceani]KFI20921.1 protein tolQ [Nitrosococcus oceani C-27]ABA56675.1 Cell division and transport-associated protein TolQ [Nitrosococcus oceani ATCC 19707]EDZ65651.1 protein TolQ [Nitrosococcus oceani AFC27]KFI24004.1 protein tolQ [Nitrosococcus oceani]GEM20755.1 Tol-Pal system subunit TolQ [Nitrosococcus oceani]
MTVDLSLLDLITGASFLVQLVILILLIISVIAWTLIFRKRSELKQAREEADEFEDRFWSGKELNSLYAELAAQELPPGGMEGIFLAGFSEFARLRKQAGVEHRTVLDGTQRAMRVSLAREIDMLEASLPFLATAGSTSPYIGLFGTVWGIMNSFRGLGNAHQATLAMVAPGIAEALIATAMGLFAAIPAVIAYNRYAYEVERLANRYDTFVEEFSTILQRQIHTV